MLDLASCSVSRRSNGSPRRKGPRERLARAGREALSDVELVALLLGGDLRCASDVVASLGGARGLRRAQLGELRAVRGVGVARACQLLAALELGAAPRERAAGAPSSPRGRGGLPRRHGRPRAGGAARPGARRSHRPVVRSWWRAAPSTGSTPPPTCSGRSCGRAPRARPSSSTTTRGRSPLRARTTPTSRAAVKCRPNGRRGGRRPPGDCPLGRLPARSSIIDLIEWGGEILDTLSPLATVPTVT